METPVPVDEQGAYRITRFHRNSGGCLVEYGFSTYKNAPF
jgi:hypothetical protein